MTDENAQAPTLTVTGRVSIPVPSDVAWLHLVLVERAAIFSEAMEQNSERMSLVLDRVRESDPRLPETVAEVERKVLPLFDDHGAGDGFEVRRVVRAQLPAESAGLLLDVAIMAGAGPGSRIVFGVRNPAVARARAIGAAVAVARDDAAAAAHSLGCELGELLSTTVEAKVPNECEELLLVVEAQAQLVYARSS